MRKVINWSDINAIKKAKNIVLDGGIIAYPTDTIYGLGVDATNKKAILKLNSIKNRTGPISVIASDINIVSKWINLSNEKKKLVLNKFGPNRTIIAPVHDNIVDKMILGKNNTLGIRIINHTFCKSLSKSCEFPITTTSINKTGKNPEINVDGIIASFKNEIDLIIEDGELNNSASSIYMYQKNSLKKIR
tara:strand:- start:149 stop:718 length:570 start_codon:yes stop_codon:yes gene_type:complete